MLLVAGGAKINRHGDVLWVIGVHHRSCRPLDLGRQNHRLLNLRPLRQPLPGQPVVGLGHNGVDELLLCGHRVATQRHYRVAPVAVGGFAVVIDGNRPRKPLGRGLQIPLLAGRISRVESCFIELRISLRRSRILRHRGGKISRAKRLISLRQQSFSRTLKVGIDRLVGINLSHQAYVFGRIAQFDGSPSGVPLPRPHRLHLRRVTQLDSAGVQATGQPHEIKALIRMCLGQILIERQRLRQP